MTPLMLIEIVKVKDQGGELNSRAIMAESYLGFTLNSLLGGRCFKYSLTLQLGDV
jgi:hypothetical protein